MTHSRFVRGEAVKGDHAMTTRPEWKNGAKHAPAHEVYGVIIADQHGGDWSKYAAWIKQQPNMLAAVKQLSESRQMAWDVLMGITR